MNDQERITDLLMTEKKMSNNYDTYASECVHPKLKDAFLTALTRVRPSRVTCSTLPRAEAGTRPSRQTVHRSTRRIKVLLYELTSA